MFLMLIILFELIILLKLNFHLRLRIIFCVFIYFKIFIRVSHFYTVWSAAGFKGGKILMAWLTLKMEMSWDDWLIKLIKL